GPMLVLSARTDYPMHLPPHALTHRLMKRWTATLAAIIAVGVILSLVASTHATSASPQGASRVVSGQSAASTYRNVPAGTQGPIRVSCTAGGVAAIGVDGPAGPQGPVGVSCAPSSEG